jgi:hypothetical protein
MPSVTTNLNAIPAPVWIALAIVGFVIWWPLGLMVIACLIWSGKMWCCGMGFDHWGYRADNVSPVWSRNSAGDRPSPASGNRAFDEYRIETLRRLEEEQREFRTFLDRLRMAKDKAEFDQFMSERRNVATAHRTLDGPQ